MCSPIELIVYILLGIFALLAIVGVVFGEIQSYKMRKFFQNETKRFNAELLKLAKKGKNAKNK